MHELSQDTSGVAMPSEIERDTKVSFRDTMIYLTVMVFLSMGYLYSLQLDLNARACVLPAVVDKI